jgi:hypothetical protein
MTTTPEKVIMYDSPEAAKKVTMELWQASDGRLSVTEDTARNNGCTHKLCECGGLMQRYQSKCDNCHRKDRRERFNALPFREWDFKEPLCDWDGDKYFFNEEEIIDHLEENDITEIDLLICDPNHWTTVDSDYWADNMPEDSDGELPKEMQKALDALNAIIKALPPQSYSPGKIRTKYTLNDQS